MSDNTVAEKTINQLKIRLDTAINARSELEEEFKQQSSLLINFIGKLSQACKGIDILLDNKLANLRVSLKKATTFADLETQILTIAALLQQHSVQNDKNIQALHEQLQAAGVNLQKISELPNSTRKQLKSCIDESNDSKASLVQYIPVLSQFITIYESALKAKDNVPAGGLLNAANQVSATKINKVELAKQDAAAAKNNGPVSNQIIERFSSILNDLIVSEKHKADISRIKTTLSPSISNNVLMTNCLNVFDLIIDDLQQERNTAKIFLSTLSETLATVQASVNSTISSTESSHAQHRQLNQQLQQKINEMTTGLNSVSTLADMKVDVNDKLLQIAKTIAQKGKLEEIQQQTLKEKLENMSAQVDKLEKQSQSFEKRIQEQQAKSLTDALTKLGNRAAFDEHFAKEMVRFHHKNFELAITVIDLDDFKRINDTYGHTAGDKTLQVIANTLTKVIGKDVFIGRYGGEEFVIVFNNCDKITVINRLNVLRKKVASLPFTFKNNRVSITLSIGVTHVNQEDNIHSAFERADTALYKAKKEGKNKVVYG
jgi:diguanylate cyclase (GGDEF)-like protein